MTKPWSGLDPDPALRVETICGSEKLIMSSVAELWHFGTDPYLLLTEPDLDPDPAIFVNDLKFFCLFLFEVTFTSFLKDKKFRKKSQNRRNQGFSYYFCLMIKGSRSVALTNGSGRPKTWLRTLRIRIRNTGYVGYLVEARKRTTSAISEGSPMWPRGIWLNNLSIT